jgi:hypothetical protein
MLPFVKIKQKNKRQNEKGMPEDGDKKVQDGRWPSKS